MNSTKSILNFKTYSKLFSDKSLTQKAYLNALTSALEAGARLVVGFIINPILVNGLGAFGYGVWQVLGNLIGYISPASGRPTQALKWSIANKQASTDFQEKRLQVGSAVTVSMLFMPLLIIIGGVLGWFAPNWLDTPDEYYFIVRIAAALLVANMMIISIADIPRAILTGENLHYKSIAINTMLVFVGGGLTALALYLDSGLIGVAAATLATTLLTGILFLKIVKTYVPWLGISKPPFQAVRKFIMLSGWFLAWNLVMKLMQASDVVILGFFGSAELVTSYTLTKYVPQTLVSFIAILVLSITPGLGGIIGSGNLQKAARVRNEIMVFTWLIVTVFGSTILLWNKSFLYLWVGKEFYAGSVPTLLIIMVVTQFALIRTDANIIDLTLKLKHKVLLGLSSTVLSIIIAVIAISQFNAGISGLCISFICGRAVLSIGYPWLIRRFLNLSISSQLKPILRISFICILLWALTFNLGDVIVLNSWLGFIPAVGLTLGLTITLAFYVGIRLDQRKLLIERIRNVAAG